MRVVCALSYSKVPHGSFIGFPWCSRVPKSKCGNNMKFVHVGNYRQRQGFDTRYFLHIASAMRVLTFCNTALDLIEKTLPLQFFCFPLLSPILIAAFTATAALSPSFVSPLPQSASTLQKWQKIIAVWGLYMGLCRCNLWIPCQSPKLRQNQQNMSKKYTANSKIITHMAGLKLKSQWYRISIRFMPEKKTGVERSTFDPCHRLNPDCRMNPGPNAGALELPGADKRRFVFSALHGSGASVTTGAPAVCAGFHLGGTPPGCSWPLELLL